MATKDYSDVIIGALLLDDDEVVESLMDNNILNSLLEEEETLIHAALVMRPKPVTPPEWLKYADAKICKLTKYCHQFIPDFRDPDFINHFKMSRETFELLLQIIGPYYTLLSSTTGRPRRSVEVFALMAMWTLGNQETFRGIGERFGTSKAGAHDTIFTFCQMVIQAMSDWIVWPTEDKIEKVQKKFESIAGVPGVVGALDSTQIAIDASKEEPSAYLNRFGVHSINLTAVCDADMNFTYVFVGYPGSLTDSEVLAESSLMNNIEKGPELMFPNDSYLVGGSSYCLSEHLMTPYQEEESLDDVKAEFNVRLALTRLPIFRVFHNLHLKFNRLKHLRIRKVHNASKVVHACCILHNFCLTQDSNPIIVESEDGYDDDDSMFDESPRRYSARAISKRNNIARSLRPWFHSSN